MPDTLTVEAFTNGPFKISGATSASFCGESLEVDGDLFLCRCGDSANAPFCDGTHREMGFVGSSEPGEAKDKRVWQGRTLRTVFDPNVCMHVFYCKPLGDLRERELAGDEDHAAQEIARVVQSCPSGALTYALEPGTPDVEPEQPVADVIIVEGGEVRLTRSFTAVGFELRGDQPDDRVTLCRCGRSKSKPYCDGRHKGRPDFT